MPYLPTVLTVTIETNDDGAIRLRKQKINVPSGVALTPRANPAEPYRQDGIPAYPDEPPYAIQCNNREEALRTAHDCFEQMRVGKTGPWMTKATYDDVYLEWVNNMTNLTVAIDEVDAAIPMSAERQSRYDQQRVYRNISLTTPKWIVYIGGLWWEEHR